MSRIRCTRYQRPGTTNHPHHLGTDVTFFLPRSHLKKTLINTWYNIPPPSILIILLHFMVFVCTWCSWCVLLIFFSFGLDDFFTRWCAWYLLRFCHLVTGTPTLQGFCADAHHFTTEMLVGGGWCWLDDIEIFPLQKWVHFGDPGTVSYTHLTLPTKA